MKKKILINLALIIVLSVSLNACTGILYLDLEKQRGASLERVLKVKGEPMRREAYSVDSDAYDILFYREYKADDDFNPFIFKNQELDGWGMSYYERIKQKANN